MQVGRTLVLAGAVAAAGALVAILGLVLARQGSAEPETEPELELDAA